MDVPQTPVSLLVTGLRGSVAVSHSVTPIRSTPITVGSPARDHAVVDAQLRQLALVRWLFNEYAAQRLRHQVMDALDGRVDELLDERLVIREQR